MMDITKHVLNKYSKCEVTWKTYKEVQEELYVFLTSEVASCTYHLVYFCRKRP